MAIKKTELYSSLWASCDQLRGGMDASQYKDYILTLLFLKYVSDKFLTDKNAQIIIPDGCTFPDMVKLKGDKEIGEKIRIILDDIAKENEMPWLANKDNDFNDEERLGKGKEMVDRLSKLVGIFEGLDFAGNSSHDDDLLGDAYEYLMRNFATESGKSKGQFYTPAEVSRIIAKIVGINANTKQDETVYDPTCGSGSLLLKAANQAPNGLSIYGQEKEVATTTLCRMNMILHDNADAEIALGGHSTLANPEFVNENGSLKTFDFAVANPPFSYKAWSNGLNTNDDEFARFEYGTPPDKNGDYAFLLHILKSLKSTGKGVVVLPHGVLFRGNAEASIRRKLITQGYFKGIIGLPANLFYGTGIPACLIVLDKAGATKRLQDSKSGIFMIDASRGFIKDGPKNRLREQDIHKIVDVFSKQQTVEKYARMVSFAEIENNDFNLNIPRYIDASTPEDLHDLNAHLLGGIPNRDIQALESYWQVFPTLENKLFKTVRKGYVQTTIKVNDIKSHILQNQDYQKFAESSLNIFTKWKKQASLHKIDQQDLPKAIINRISEELLKTFKNTDLINHYDMYQILMDYWQQTMQDDVYVITQDGWQAGSLIKELKVIKGNKLKETPDLVISKKKYKAEIIPPQLIIKRYFKDQQQKLDDMQQAVDEQSQTLESLIEEHANEEGALNQISSKADANTALKNYYEIAFKNRQPENFNKYQKAQTAIEQQQGELNNIAQGIIFDRAKNAKSQITLTNIKNLLKEFLTDTEKQQLNDYLIQNDVIKTQNKLLKTLYDNAILQIDTDINNGEKDDILTDIVVLKEFLQLTAIKAATKKHLSTAQTQLNKQVLAHYAQLSVGDINTLVVQDKWHATLQTSIGGEIERISQQLSNRIKTLEQRYAQPLPKLQSSVQSHSDKVSKHLKHMGLEW